METRLKEIRKSRGYKSAKAFAESIGMQEKTYRNYEQGVRNLYLDVACELCTALDCSLDELVGRAPSMEKKPPVSADEAELIRLFDRMVDEDRETFVNMARTLALAGDIKKKDAVGAVALVGEDVI